MGEGLETWPDQQVRPRRWSKSVLRAPFCELWLRHITSALAREVQPPFFNATLGTRMRVRLTHEYATHAELHACLTQRLAQAGLPTLRTHLALSPWLVLDAPELATLEALRGLLDITRAALLAANLGLLQGDARHSPAEATEWLADLVLLQAAALEEALRRLRDAVEWQRDQAAEAHHGGPPF